MFVTSRKLEEYEYFLGELSPGTKGSLGFAVEKTQARRDVLFWKSCVFNDVMDAADVHEHFDEDEMR